jgi:hypothetical protein
MHSASGSAGGGSTRRAAALGASARLWRITRCASLIRGRSGGGARSNSPKRRPRMELFPVHTHQQIRVRPVLKELVVLQSSKNNAVKTGTLEAVMRAEGWTEGVLSDTRSGETPACTYCPPPTCAKTQAVRERPSEARDRWGRQGPPSRDFHHGLLETAHAALAQPVKVAAPRRQQPDSHCGVQGRP